MKDLIIKVSFDFDVKHSEEKQNFLKYLSDNNWTTIDSENNWKKTFNNISTIESLIFKIKEEFLKASKNSKLKKADYIILTEQFIYFDFIK